MDIRCALSREILSLLGKLASCLVNAIFIAMFGASKFRCLSSEQGGRYFRQSYFDLDVIGYGQPLWMFALVRIPALSRTLLLRKVAKTRNRRSKEKAKL
jgi:hypothetical protein